jgi:hypothetical protein
MASASARGRLRAARAAAASSRVVASISSSLGSKRASRGAARALRERRRATTSTATRRRRDARAFALFGPPPDPALLLAEGKALYAEGERMRGYKTFERALRQDTIDVETRRELLYCCMCCNAAFGDVETAKQFLRDMNIAGLPFDVAMLDDRLMPLESSAQMRNQLVKFASGEMKSQGTVQREIFERDRAPRGNLGAMGGGGAGKPQRMGDMDLMNLEISGDTSAETKDIVKRVLGLVVASVAGFVGLFQFGLTFLR